MRKRSALIADTCEEVPARTERQAGDEVRVQAPTVHGKTGVHHWSPQPGAVLHVDVGDEVGHVIGKPPLVRVKKQQWRVLGDQVVHQDITGCGWI